MPHGTEIVLVPDCTITDIGVPLRSAPNRSQASKCSTRHAYIPPASSSVSSNEKMVCLEIKSESLPD